MKKIELKLTRHAVSYKMEGALCWIRT